MNRNPTSSPTRAGASFALRLAGVALAAVVASHALPPARADTPPAPLDLTLADAIRVALDHNRGLVHARLGREAQRFALRVAEHRFRPQVSVGPYLERGHTDADAGRTAAGVATALTVRVPTGGAFDARWSVAGADGGGVADYAHALALAFRQPLLRGAGVAVNEAPVTIARLAEAGHVLALRQTVIDTVTRVITRYRAALRAGRQVAIREGSLARARAQLAVSADLVRTGRMAEREIVQTEADIARRELDLVAARNGLEAARLALTDILDIDAATELRLADALDAAPDPAALPDAEALLATAFGHRPDWLRAGLAVRRSEAARRVAANARRWDLTTSVEARFAGAGTDTLSGARRLRGTDWQARLDLAIPIGPATVDPREQVYVAADVALRQARNAVAALRQRIRIEVGNAVREAALARRQVELARTARALVEEKTAIEQEKLGLGLSSAFRVAAFEDDLVAAETAELDAVVALLGARTTLDRVLGTTLATWGIAPAAVEPGP